MKKVTFWYIVLIAAIFDCGSQVVMESEPPLHIIDAVYERTREDSILLRIELDNAAGVTMLKVHYMGRWARPELRQDQTTTTVSVNFHRQEKNITMHSDPRREVGNQPPPLKGDKKGDPFFNLGPDEAILYYESDGRPAYFKVSGIRKGIRPGD
jgi:hypothetical protein